LATEDLPKPPSPAGEPAAALRPRKILVVDDIGDNRDVLRAALRNDGYEVAEAGGGAAALEAVARLKPDLMLLDLMMPEIDGFQVLRKLRESADCGTMAVIVVTAVTEAESQALALDLGADDYLTKPFDPAVLRARVKAVFRRR
jgi:DNA-binding response OmpR family regulator